MSQPRVDDGKRCALLLTARRILRSKMQQFATFWRKLKWRHVVVAFAIVSALYWKGQELYFIFHQPTGVHGTIRSKDGEGVSQVVVRLFRKDHDQGLSGRLSDSDGSFEIQRQAEKGEVLILQMTHRQFQPYRSTIIADRKNHEINVTLDRQPEWHSIGFKAGDSAEHWTGSDWCDVVIISVGTVDSPTNEGVKDMKGQYYIGVIHRQKGFWESASNLRPFGIRGFRHCLED